MIKKSVSILLLVFICLFSVYAGQTPNQLVIIGYDGVSGIPVGANYFHADTGGSWSKTKNQSPSSYPDSADFGNTEMIGFIQFYYLDGSKTQKIDMNGTITVTITCPNGFYLTSQSNPNYKRPFEILLSPGWTTGESKKVTDDQPTQTFTINKSGYNHIHFDVVISLPGKTENSTKECTVTSSTGKTTIYPLDDLTDYSAVVTFEVTYTDSSGNVVITKSLTLPFSGYYDSSVTTPSPHTTDKGYDGVSMNIILNSEAYNIDIENKRGTWIPIGEFYFNMMLGQIDEKSDTSKKAAIFFSSSENPWDTNAEKFTMVHDDVKTNTPLTTQNSIGFTLQTVNLDKTSEIRTFDGTTYFEKSYGSSDSTIDETKYIIPAFTAGKMYDYYNGSNTSVRSYFSYKGRIEIMLDNNGITMLQGRYTETIYVHVMVYN